jgi:hypothetical protein
LQKGFVDVLKPVKVVEKQKPIGSHSPSTRILLSLSSPLLFFLSIRDKSWKSLALLFLSNPLARLSTT